MRIRDYDIIVIGAGHAGCEAALAAARMGLQTAVITMRLDTIAQMPCNPAIGGLAKGHLVKEIDALGGEMARNTDRSSIQFRMLNTKKGPAVWGPRAQCDKKRYSHAMRTVLETQPNLTVIQDSVEDILAENGTVAGVRILSGAVITAHAVIVTTGTFLKGLIHVGDHNYEAGRYGEPPAKTLSDSLRALGYKLGRLKTGTPPRIKRDSINFDATAVQPPDDVYQSFSRAIKQPMLPQVNCWITYTTDATKKAIMDNIHRSPLYAGKISGIGPRYCPSIEDKIVKFPHKEKHQIFIEPEGLDTDLMYINGASSSMPEDVQEAVIHSIIGLENAEFVRYGYAVEYDFSLTDQILPTMETRLHSGLYFAGQINGTSGYEEAAAQGLIAGINAALKIQRRPPFVIGRDEAYIGVLIDDLITKIPIDPYRMFTSRAEFRLLLRQDNAYQRLAHYGYSFGLIDDQTWSEVSASKLHVKNEIERLNRIKYDDLTAAQLLKRQDMSYTQLIEDEYISQPPAALSADEIFEIEIEIKYEGYIHKQHQQAEKLKKYEDWRIPAELDYKSIIGLRNEARQKLSDNRPLTLGQALRIPGVNPADIQLVMIHMERIRRSTAAC